MFGSSIGAGEILLILAVILLLFGAQRLPSIARSLGRALEEFRRSASDLTRDILDEHHPPPDPPPSSQLPDLSVSAPLRENPSSPSPSSQPSDIASEEKQG